MKRMMIVAAILMVGSIQGFSQTKNFIDQPFIETSARVDTLVTPDNIYLNITIAEQDTKGRVSVEQQESAMVSSLKALGINTKKDLMLNDAASNFRKYFLRQQEVLKRKSYTLLVHNAIMAGKVIIALEQLNISNVNISKTEYSNMENLKLTLLSKAVAKARIKAAFMTKPLHQKVGAALYISENTGYYSYKASATPLRVRGVGSANKSYAPADIQFQKIRVESSINVKFKLE
jgi:uncharacterized protein YggE